jgi:hypothetical protein
VQEQVFAMQDTPLKWKPALQPEQIAAPLEVQDVPVAAVPPEQEQLFVTQATPVR